MKHIYFFILCIILFNSCHTPKQTYEDTIKQFQYELNTQYADASESPLTKEDLPTFRGLDFFTIDKNYQIEAKLELTPNSPIFEMQTTTDRLPLFKIYGIAYFTLNGEKCTLNLYQSQDYSNTINHQNLLFLPFNDLTNGISSYSGGRFIDLETSSAENNTIIIDFNKAYNPYCAYNHKYSCPVPPSENNLPIAITAGVKDYKKHH
ncbi:hypothetical protein SAMN06265371_103280 [Lutibacter agarilyticus]|uniref:DUF1684 domain-containing protein n=1 Tax=Lutibacter agarilyticus TaxID=1109740 RepID=A0A238WJ49_9FLAO|nr:DUF1684 domain-containing protein [Lutibacter agarilyticus]SNR46592.1 hypothetical protein SAMN06265371_103280 [Lutibacter agarilyticus]